MVLSDMDKGEDARLPGKETATRRGWEDVNQHLPPSVRLDSHSSSSRNANHLGEPVVPLLAG